MVEGSLVDVDDDIRVDCGIGKEKVVVWVGTRAFFAVGKDRRRKRERADQGE